MLSEVLAKMDQVRESRLLTISKPNKNLALKFDAPPVHCSGFYWIYTSYTIDELVNCTPATERAAVKIRWEKIILITQFDGIVSMHIRN